MYGLSLPSCAVFGVGAQEANVEKGCSVVSKTVTDREVLSPEELAEFLGCGRTYAYKLLARGEIRSFKIGRLRRIRRQDVERYLQTRLGAADEV